APWAQSGPVHAFSALSAARAAAHAAGLSEGAPLTATSHSGLLGASSWGAAAAGCSASCAGVGVSAPQAARTASERRAAGGDRIAPTIPASATRGTGPARPRASVARSPGYRTPPARSGCAARGGVASAAMETKKYRLYVIESDDEGLKGERFDLTH